MYANLTCLRTDMMLKLTKVLDWLRQRAKVRILMCSVSFVVGLVCYALSSSSHEWFEKMKWRKMVPYIILGVILIFGDVWFTNRSHRPRFILVLVLVATSMYTYFVDENVELKPDAFILVSYAAFAIMSLFLSTLSHIGFEDEILYFFTCNLIILLMKIKFWLVIFGWGFMEVLVRLGPTLDPALRSEAQRDQNDVATEVENRNQPGTRLIGSQEDLAQEVHVPPPQNEDEVRLLISHVPQENEEGNSDNSDIVKARFMNCIAALERENISATNTVFKNGNLVDEALPQLVVKSLPSEIINNLNGSAQLMVKAGLWDICLEEYSRLGRKFLDMFLLLFNLPNPNLNMEDINEVKKIDGWLDTLTVAVRVLLPNEMTLCQRVFGSNNLSNLAFVEVCKELMTRLIGTCYVLITWSHHSPTEKLDKLMEELYTTFNDLSDETSSRIRIRDEVNQVRMILANFERLKGDLTNGYEAQGTAADGIHFMTRAVMDYIRYEFIKRDGSLGQSFEEYARAAKNGKLRPSGLVETIINLLENNLEATSRSYKTPSLGYVFIMINRTLIAHEIKRLGLNPIIGYDWIKGNQDKIEQNLQLYLRSSWYKILEFLNVDFYYRESEHVVSELLENNHSSFKQQFDEICNDNSMWLVSTGKLRDRIIKSIKNILLPAYREFIKSYEDLFPKYSYVIIRPEPQVVEDRLNNLFLERADESDVIIEEKKNV